MSDVIEAKFEHEEEDWVLVAKQVCLSRASCPVNAHVFLTNSFPTCALGNLGPGVSADRTHPCPHEPRLCIEARSGGGRSIPPRPLPASTASPCASRSHRQRPRESLHLHDQRTHHRRSTAHPRWKRDVEASLLRLVHRRWLSPRNSGTSISELPSSSLVFDEMMWEH
jgi:hypothetical protein